MPKRKNYPYRSPEDIIKDANRQYNELLQENKFLRNENKRLHKNYVIQRNNAIEISVEIGRMLTEFYAVKNNIVIARNSKAELRDFYIDKTLYGLDCHIEYLTGAIEKLVNLGYIEFKGDYEIVMNEIKNTYTPLPINLLTEFNND